MIDPKQEHLIPMSGKGIVYMKRLSTLSLFSKPEKGSETQYTTNETAAGGGRGIKYTKPTGEFGCCDS